jgi:hypothetical protein
MKIQETIEPCAGEFGQAGGALSLEEERLQQIVIENSRFTEMGLRKKAGFVGEHDRATGAPIPDHISATAKILNP